MAERGRSGSSSTAVEDTDVEQNKLLDSGGGGKKDAEIQEVDWTITGPAFLFPALGGALFGYDIGATSGALLSIQNATTSGTDWYNLSPLQSGAVVSASLLGALAGSAAAFVWGDKLGRRKELLLAAGLYGGAAATMYLAPSYPILVAGRVAYGLGIGFAMHAAPAYIAEVVPPKVRGLLISLKEGLVVTGILTGYSMSYLFVDQMGGWRTMFGAALLPALLLGAGMFWLMDSPRWLLLNGQREEATSALARARGRYGSDSAAVEAEVNGIAKSLRPSGEPDPGFGALFRGNNLRPLLVGGSLMLFQQITGQPSVLYYASQIFQDAGFAGGKDATRVSVLLGLFKLIMTGATVVTVDKWGRRPLLLFGVAAMTVALSGLALSSYQNLPPQFGVAAILCYTGAYQISFGPISWLIVGEVFPLSVRGQATAIASLTNFGSNFGVSLVLPTLQSSLGLGTTYSLFALISVAAWASIYLTVPETKGKTLEEIEAMFAEGGKVE